MTPITNDYIIAGGREGKSRLNVLAEVLQESTKSLLLRTGLSAGMTMLDAGCGGGNVALLASEIVGDAGHITAIDFDGEIIDLAARDAADAGISNVSFNAMSVYDISFENTFDIVYARFLLSHLTKPGDVLAKMLRSVKSGGKVVVEDIHFSGHFCFPECDAFTRYVALFKAAAHHNGHNAEIGPSLFSMFRNAGIQDVGFEVMLPAFNKGKGKWMAWLTLDRIKGAVLDQGLASREALDKMLSELEVFTNDESTVMSLPHIFRVWGRKP